MTSVLAWLRREMAWLGAVAVAVLVGLVVGRCSRPTPAVVTETTKAEAHQVVDQHQAEATVAVQVEDHQEARATVRHRVVQRDERRPDGTQVVTTTTDDTRTDAAGSTRASSAATTAAATDTHATLDRKEEHTRTEVRRADNRLTLSPGWSKVRALPTEVSLDYSRRALGPVWLGVWARGDVDQVLKLKPRGAAGVSLAFEW